jgi:hypothetical protein
MSDTPKKEPEFTVIMTDEVRAQVEADPEMAKAMRELTACFHQAHAAVEAGQYGSMEDAMEAITGNRPEPVNLEDDEDDLGSEVT